jgi:hypothetical protein
MFNSGPCGLPPYCIKSEARLRHKYTTAFCGTGPLSSTRRAVGSRYLARAHPIQRKSPVFWLCLESMKRGSKICVAANAFGLLLYVILVVRILHRIHVEDRPSDFGDAMMYDLTAFPIMLVFAITNASWVIWGSVQLVRYRERRPLILCAVAIVTWSLSILILSNFS